MAWTAPRTWVTSEVVTASIMNTHVRDNFLETAPGKATAADGFIVTTAANTVTQRTPSGVNVSTSETTTSTSYVDLATTGPTMTLTTGTRVFVLMKARVSNSGAGNTCWISCGITGASALTATDNGGAVFESSAANDESTITTGFIRADLTAGSNTFTMKYRVSAGTGTFQQRWLTVIPFG